MSDGPELVHASAPLVEHRPRKVRPRARATDRVASSARGGVARAPAPGHVPSLANIPVHPATVERRVPAYDEHEAEADRVAELLFLGPLDTSAVRIHSGPESAGLADALDADAVTVGRDIHLGADHPPLDSSEGRRLIAHELAHVRQQAIGAAPRGVPQTKASKKKKRSKGVPFKISVDRKMGPDELLRTFVEQYYRITNPLE